MEEERYSIHYRAAETSQMMSWLKAGRSGCLVGLRGTGKSNLLRFILRPDVQRHYLGLDSADYAFALIDGLAMTECAEWAVYERIVDRLLERMPPPAPDKAARLAELHRQIVRTRDPLDGRRAVETCLDHICRHSNERLILVFDEFDRAFGLLDAALFRSLRAIRDTHKDQVSYIVVVTNDLACLRDDLAEVEHFYRLVARNVCHLGPYNEEDARQMIHYLAYRQEIELGEENTAHLIELSGGHAGLLKTMLSLLWTKQPTGALAQLVPTLKDDPTVQAECRKVWDSLPTSHQAALRALTVGAHVDGQTLLHLRQMGLVGERESGHTIFSPLFASFIRQETPTVESVVIDRTAHHAQLGGRRIETLSELEFEMLCYLYEHRGQICTKDELIADVYRQRYDKMLGGVSDQALQTLIARLRAKIEPDSSHPRYIRTIRGQGYTFTVPEPCRGDV